MSTVKRLRPDVFVTEEVFNEGFKIMKALGFVDVRVGCFYVSVTEVGRKYWVPVIIATRPENVGNRRAPSVYMFFGGQFESDENGTALYALFEARLRNGLPVEIPKLEIKSLCWNRKIPA